MATNKFHEFIVSFSQFSLHKATAITKHENVFSKMDQIQKFLCVKSVLIRSFFGPYFSAFGLNTEIYRVNLRIQSKYGKMRSRKTRKMDTFYAMFLWNVNVECLLNTVGVKR